ncbi:MAG TPA: serine--tRNA ligase [Candidatus Cloacimonetes bacterium]|nr:serine--tRNA ligase [Candidatus Cloacimonadota bacterium]
MLDLKFIRENPEIIKKAIQHKNEKADVDELLNIDEKKRKLQFEYDNLKSQQNKVSKNIPILKKQKKDVTDLLVQMTDISGKIKEIASRLSDVSQKLERILLTIPNIPHTDVPIGNDESFNSLVKTFSEKKAFTFTPKDHLELGKAEALFDFKRASKIAGTGHSIYTGNGAMLERALINFMLDFHIQNHNYKEISAPFLVNRKTMTGTGQLPKLEADMYRIEEEDMFLIPTSEVSVTNIYSDEILPYTMLPQKYVSYSPCFRREAGSYGKDTKGLQRLHQFNKVEMVRFVKPDNSYKVLDEMLQDAEDILIALGLHYRVVILATGDLSFASAKTYDIEVWSPGTGKYLEVSSISNFEDFQSRRASIRFRDEDSKVKFVHTLNGSGVATPRTMIALLENYQNEDGTISIPDVLKPYLPDIDVI